MTQLVSTQSITPLYLDKEATIGHSDLGFLTLTCPQIQAWETRLAVDSEEVQIIVKTSKNSTSFSYTHARKC
jgi:hypothetical protein